MGVARRVDVLLNQASPSSHDIWILLFPCLPDSYLLLLGILDVSGTNRLGSGLHIDTRWWSDVSDDGRSAVAPFPGWGLPLAAGQSDGDLRSN